MRKAVLFAAAITIVVGVASAEAASSATKILFATRQLAGSAGRLAPAQPST